MMKEDCRRAIIQYFNMAPFTMRAAFALTEPEERAGEYLLHLRDLIRLNDTDYAFQTCDGMGFRSGVLLDILHKASGGGSGGIIYLHSHQRGPVKAARNDDHSMIFRIFYAYLPFGIHASLHYANEELTGRVWLPHIYQTVPANIIYA